jgi:hypothetical protein
MLVVPATSTYPTNSIDRVAQQFSLSIINWELNHLGGISLQIWPSNSQPYVGHDGDSFLVFRYFDLVRRISELDTEEQNVSVSGQIEQLRSERDELSDTAQYILKWQITQVLDEEGLTESIGAAYDILFPPLEFKMTDLPLILAVSPREMIELERTVLLKSSLSDQEITQIEKGVEKLGFSAEIERISGLALYPSLIPRTDSLSYTLAVITHEWFHQYLFFKPLGRAYWASSDMTTINETVAQIVGNELGDLVYQRYYENEGDGSRVMNETIEVDETFNFSAEMRETRLAVDWYLEQGMVEEAEEYMEERRLLFVRHGYAIRKLNQAYFAFHGTYADDPASVSPIGQELAELRAEANSLGEFIATVARISTPADLAMLTSTP